MLPRLQGLMNNIFHSNDKRSFNYCKDRGNVRIMIDITVQDETSSGENVVVEGESLLVEPSIAESVVESHGAQCSCRNCDELLSRFAECSICLEPIQTYGPCVCPLCGGFWCGKCSQRLKNCAWCRANLRPAVTPCPALTRLVNNLLLPCRNFSRGCRQRLLADNRVEHEENCKYDTLMCPLPGNCDSFSLSLLTEHLQYAHQVIAIHSTRIKVLIENFQNKLKSTASRKTKYKMFMLHDKCAFIVKMTIHKYMVRVELCRRRLGYLAECNATQPKISEYRAEVEFHCSALAKTEFMPIENGSYGARKAEVHFNDMAVFRNEEIVTVDVHVFKPEFDRPI